MFDNPSTYGSVSLAAYEEGVFNVRNAPELRAAVDEVRRDSPAARAKRARWPELLDRVLGDLERPLGLQMTDALARLDVPAPAGTAKS